MQLRLKFFSQIHEMMIKMQMFFVASCHVLDSYFRQCWNGCLRYYGVVAVLGPSFGRSLPDMQHTIFFPQRALQISKDSVFHLEFLHTASPSG